MRTSYPLSPGKNSPLKLENAPAPVDYDETVINRFKRRAPAVLLTLYHLYLWIPEYIALPAVRWYMPLGVALFAFLLLRMPLNMRAAKPFWLIYGLALFGAILSLLRAPNIDLVLWNTVGMGFIFVTFLLFVPILAAPLRANCY
jgi:hypothetical protein